ATKIPVDRVYEIEYPTLGINGKRLLVVIDSKSQIATKTLEPMAELCLAETPERSFHLIPYGELKTAINHGSLYYVLTCQPENLRLAVGAKPLPILTRKTLETIRTKAQEHYEKGLA